MKKDEILNVSEKTSISKNIDKVLLEFTKLCFTLKIMLSYVVHYIITSHACKLNLDIWPAQRQSTCLACIRL